MYLKLLQGNVFSVKITFNVLPFNSQELLFARIVQNYEPKGVAHSSAAIRVHLFKGRFMRFKRRLVQMSRSAEDDRGRLSCSIWRVRSSGKKLWTSSPGSCGVIQHAHTHTQSFSLHFQSLWPESCRIMSDVINVWSYCSHFTCNELVTG